MKAAPIATTRSKILSDIPFFRYPTTKHEPPIRVTRVHPTVRAARAVTNRESANDGRAHHYASSCDMTPPSCPVQRVTVTRKKVAGMDVVSSCELLFWPLNRFSSSFCRSLARPFFSAASNAFMVGP